MREGIGVYRGKRLDNGEWIEGDLLHPDIFENGYSIEDFTKGKNNCFDVDEKTLGQWTGLVDANGVKIFEGDLVTIENTKKQGLPACIRWKQENCQFVVSRNGYQPINIGCFEDKTQWVVIGNIYDKAVEE